MKKISIAVHGGAQNSPREEYSAEKELAYKSALSEAVSTGWRILENGGSALDAVEAAVVVMEDNPLFNAARGGAVNAEGKVECDAAIMCGKTLLAGAAAAVRNVRNPVKLARTILRGGIHLLLCGEGASEMADKFSLQREPDEYFITPERLGAQKKEREKQGKAFSGHTGSVERSAAVEAGQSDAGEQGEFGQKGTVGAVALDEYGNLAAATSTGGLTNKMKGRIGDSPLIGAGTYANNQTCAVSCTGDGEFIIRGVYAHELHALMKYRKMSLREAMREVFRQNAEMIKAEMGIIAADSLGNIEMLSNTLPMFRGCRSTEKELYTALWE